MVVIGLCDLVNQLRVIHSYTQYSYYIMCDGSYRINTSLSIMVVDIVIDCAIKISGVYLNLYSFFA